MTLTRHLISLIRGKPVADTDLHRATLFVLDAVANAIAGRNTEPGRKLIQWREAQGDDAGRDAFLCGGLTHILETDDLHRASVTHPGCVVVPAALVKAGATSGPELLTAVLHGYEAMCRVGNAVGPTHYQVWHNTATCGPYGSAMAAAALQKLSDEQAMHALGNAGTQSSGVWEFLDTGAMSKHLHAGRAAESGIVASDLAALGFTGPPAILEGRKGFFAAACPDACPDAVIAEPDAPWQLAQTSIKPWPCCRHTHPVVEAALELHGQRDGRDVESVQVDSYQAALDVCNRPAPDNEYAAKFSLQHTVAAALMDGSIQFDSFNTASRGKHAALRERVAINAVEPYLSAYPEKWGARVTATLSDGAMITAERRNARGDPELALDDDQMVAKAEMLLDYANCDAAIARQVIQGVLGLADANATADLVDLVLAELRK
ncbi:MAG: MmgE/PrpD family protein [Gammaproteobacteria bacterium]|nr:MmgE/PrpD family protein [Gammaproteobacteria bacterium]